ncbi:hypothetical protein [Umezawaea sp. Da 62-37]|uniref:hypothetical protein n=1 Tax=Umezawaea sp. Da 62-37 TaxID=3075927 RepID=UPI0028F71527|nr:hypothetical protein [Umezawaea sp. Da 62-37]WNV82701.1 hypothetical protein RM788_31455 [Umezawaea sp. Da 62-37]
MGSTRATLDGAVTGLVAPRHLVLAEQLVDNMTPANNVYKDAAQRNVVRWGEPGQPDGWVNRSQCASFVTAVLKRSYPEWATGPFLTEHFGSRSPYARDYRAGFAGGGVPHFEEVPKVEDLRPGDLVAIDFRGSGGGNTGHVLMVRGVKGGYDQGLTYPGETQHAVEVVDCTSEPHGVFGLGDYSSFPDSRIVNGDEQHHGAGYGHMVFYASDVTGGFTRYRWSVNSSVSSPTTQRPLVAARLFE